MPATATRGKRHRKTVAQRIDAIERRATLDGYSDPSSCTSDRERFEDDCQGIMSHAQVDKIEKYLRRNRWRTYPDSAFTPEW